MIFDKAFYTNNRGRNIFLDLSIESTYCYIVLGLFFYLPFIALINIINLAINRLKKTKQTDK